MKNILLLAILMLSLPACVNLTIEQQGSRTANEQLRFSDLNRFDNELSEAMSSVDESVTVDFAGDVSINQIPDRMQGWLAVVDEHGKGVEIVSEDGTQNKSFALLIGLIPKIGEFIHSFEKKIVAKPYKAILILENNSDKVKSISFEKVK